MFDEEEIRSARIEEQSRGKRPIDREAIRQRQEVLIGLRELCRAGTDDDGLREAIRALGLKDGTEEFETAMQSLREMRDAQQQRP